MEYPLSIVEEKVNGLEVKLVGVQHTNSFFEEHKIFFHDEINKAEAIFLEDGPDMLTHEFYGD